MDGRQHGRFSTKTLSISASLTTAPVPYLNLVLGCNIAELNGKGFENATTSLCSLLWTHNFLITMLCIIQANGHY